MAVVILLVSVTPQVAAQESLPSEGGGGFVDIEGNAHEENIRFIVDRGLTVGCDLDGPRYCPDDPVTRAQMAAFLSRALGLDTSSPHMGVFADVAEGAWYAPFVETLGLFGLTDTQVSGSYRPNDVMLRAEMAIFLQKAFRLSLDTETGSLFGDVSSDAGYAGAVGAILGAGITRGCATDPLRFCPDDTVKRDTMASFLARAIRFVEMREVLALAPDREVFTSVSMGEDIWDVWICDDAPTGQDDVVDYLNREVGPYYRWLSAGAHQMRFQHGADPSPEVTEVLQNCGNERFVYTSPPGANIFVGGNPRGLGYRVVGAGGGWLNPISNEYSRNVWSDRGGAYDTVLYIHELGHAFGWPHNFPQRSSEVLHTGMDIMASREQVVGTNAHNLFHVGWISADQVEIHRGGTATYTISPPHTDATGVELVLLPLSPKRLISVGARAREGFDRHITAAGIEVYEIAFCYQSVGCKKVHLPPGTQSKEAVVLGAGDSWTATLTRALGDNRPLTVEVTLSVAARQEGSYRVVVEETLVSADPSTVGVGRAGVCVLLTDGAVDCWDWSGGDPTPEGQFVSMSVGNRVCGTTLEGKIECWGRSGYGTPVPEGQFATVSLNGYQGCGHRTDGTVECWGAGENRKPIGEPSPDGEFLSVTAGWSHACGMRPDLTVECWGSNEQGQATPPDGEYLKVAAGGSFTCGLRPDGTIECWGNNHHGRATPPEGSFTHVEAGLNHACGMRPDGAVVCWGTNTHGEAKAPQGVFTTVSLGDARTCGLRLDGSVECWGRNRAEE